MAICIICSAKRNNWEDTQQPTVCSYAKTRRLNKIEKWKLVGILKTYKEFVFIFVFVSLVLQYSPSNSRITNKAIRKVIKAVGILFSNLHFVPSVEKFFGMDLQPFSILSFVLTFWPLSHCFLYYLRVPIQENEIQNSDLRYLFVFSLTSFKILTAK